MIAPLDHSAPETVRPLFRNVRGSYQIARDLPPALVGWLDRNDYPQRVLTMRAQGDISENEADLLRRWSRDGYLVVEHVIGDEDRTSVLNINNELGSVKSQVAGHDCSIPQPVRYHLKSGVPRLVALILNGPGQVGVRMSSGAALDSDDARNARYHVDAFYAHQSVHSVLCWIQSDCVASFIAWRGSHRLPFLTSATPTRRILSDEVWNYVTKQRRLFPCLRFHAESGDVLLFHPRLVTSFDRRRRRSASSRFVVVRFEPAVVT